MNYKIFIIISFIFLSLPAFPLFNKNEGLKSFLWVCQDSKDTVYYGCYGYLKIDSVASVGDSTLYFSRFGLPDYSWWVNIFTKTYITGVLTVSNIRPDSLDQVCSNFSSAQWLENFERKDSTGNIQFIFPILPKGIPYHRYDYFSIKMDTTILQFQWDDDSTAIGTIINNRHNSDGRTVIYAKGAIIIRLTDKNYFRIKTIQFDTARTDLISSYLKYDFTKFTNNSPWYGLSIVDNSIFVLEKPRLLLIR